MTGELTLALLAAFAPAQERRPRVECSLERPQCYEGESIEYRVEALDVEDPTAPDLSALAADFDVQGGASQSLNSTSVQYVNGRMTRVDSLRTQFLYQLTPRRAGRLVVPAPTVAAGGKKLLGVPLELEVLAPESQEFARLFVDVSPPEVYPLRPVTVKLRVFVRRIPGAVDRDPIGTLLQLDPPPTPMLKIPWAEPPKGFDGGSASEWLTPRLVRGRRADAGGFGINELATGGMPSPLFEDFFGGPRHALFDLQGRPAIARDLAELHDVALPGAVGDYWVYRLDRTLTPTRSGAFDLGPVSLKGKVIDSLQGRRVTLKDVFAVAKPARLTVKEVPTEGRPAAFTGAIGSFAIEATVAPARAHVGDPMTLTASVTGHGNLDEIAPPALAQLPEFAHAFKVYDASAETKGGARVFTWSLRPSAASVRAVPPIPFAWFDVEREQFATAATAELPIEVVEAVALDPDAIVSSGPKAGAAPTLSTNASGLFQHDTDPRHLGDQRVTWQAHAAAAGALPLVTLAGLAAFGAWQRRRSDPRALRRRSAAARARARAQAAVAAATRDPLATADALREALGGLVADAADLEAAGLTARETKDALDRLGAPRELAQEAGAALEQWEALRYAGRAVDAAALARDGAALIARVSDALQRGGRFA